jgi:hypothetical protein
VASEDVSIPLTVVFFGTVEQNEGIRAEMTYF